MDLPNIYTLVYQNLKILCEIYADSHDVQKVLKQEMFKVPDIKAFQHVMHFLLNILIPDKWKILMIWPVFDRKTESQFRLAVKKALTEVNRIYPNANLPIASAAILTNAGGKGFAEYLWRLTIFVLRNSFEDKLGITNALSIPVPLDNDNLEKKKLVAFKALADHTVQKFIESHMNFVEGGASTYSRNISMELKHIRRIIKDEEEDMHKLVQPLTLPTEGKQKLLDLESSLGIQGWFDDLKNRTHKIKETMAFIEHIGGEIADCRQIIERSVECSASGICVDMTPLNKAMEADSEAVLHEEHSRLSNVLLKANESLDAIADEIHINGVPDLYGVLHTFKNLRAELEGLEENVNGTFSELEDKLEELRHNYNTMQNDEKFTAAENAEETESPTAPDLNFYKKISKDVKNTPTSDEKLTVTGSAQENDVPPCPDLKMSKDDVRDSFFSTPTSGAAKPFFQEKPLYQPNFDSELLFSPKLEEPSTSPFTEYESSLIKQNGNTYIPQLNRLIPKSECKFRPQATNLSVLTGSLLKSTSKAYMGRTALSTVCNKKAYVHIQRDHYTRNLPAVKTLFPKENNSSAQESSPQAFPLSPGSEDSLWDSAGDVKEHAFDLYSATSLQNEMTSPSFILSSTKKEESKTELKTKKKPIRKSMEALIERYKKVRNKMDSMPK